MVNECIIAAKVEELCQCISSTGTITPPSLASDVCFLFPLRVSLSLSPCLMIRTIESVIWQVTNFIIFNHLMLGHGSDFYRRGIDVFTEPAFNNFLKQSCVEGSHSFFRPLFRTSSGVAWCTRLNPSPTCYVQYHNFLLSAKVTIYVPSHPDLFEVVFRPGGYCSALIARKVRLPDDPSLLAMSGLLTISVVRTSRLAKSWFT